MLFGLIPAAGKSERMGRPKLSLPLLCGDRPGLSGLADQEVCRHGRTVLEHVLAAVRAGGIPEIVVVVGPHVPELAKLAEAAGAHALLLDVETPDMRATVEKGLAWLEQRFQPKPEDGWLLLPADHPTMDAELIRQVLQAGAANPERSVVIPVYQGKRGHPTLVRWKLVDKLRALPAGLGLNALFRQQSGEVFELPTNRPAAVRDLDTPEDYAALLNDGSGQ